MGGDLGYFKSSTDVSNVQSVLRIPDLNRSHGLHGQDLEFPWQCWCDEQELCFLDPWIFEFWFIKNKVGKYTKLFRHCILGIFKMLIYAPRIYKYHLSEKKKKYLGIILIEAFKSSIINKINEIFFFPGQILKAFGDLHINILQ